MIDSRDPGAAGVPIVFDIRSSDGAAQSATAAMSADGSTVAAHVVFVERLHPLPTWTPTVAGSSRIQCLRWH